MADSRYLKIQGLILLGVLVGMLPALSELTFQMWFIYLLLGCAFSSLLSFCLLRHWGRGLNALEVGLLNFKDGEFGYSIGFHHDNELGHLCQLYNEAAEKLRAEKQWVHHRELMLDKLIHSSPEGVLLINDNDQVVFSNQHARQLFGENSSIVGHTLTDMLEKLPGPLADGLRERQDGLLTLEEQGNIETWHISNGVFRLNNQPHHLFIIKPFTKELTRQEVMVWKKVIRIISHELNNSLGPISSMLHSGKLLSERLDEPKLKRVFSTIDDRIQYLTEFVQGYGTFAKLPKPQLQTTDIDELLCRVCDHYDFQFQRSGYQVKVDVVQFEQLMINLIKNAHEAGSPKEEIMVEIDQTPDFLEFSICDRGMGMSEAVLSNALIPFYSTKTSGTGIGLALCKEIVEAHHGMIKIQNRDKGGLLVKLFIPHNLS